MEATSFSETSVDFQRTGRSYIPEDSLTDFFGFLRIVFRAEGPPTSKTLLMPWGSNLTIVGSP
jgi:hypothetical protein